MQFDFGLSGVLEKVEDRFGRNFTTGLLVLIVGAIVVLCGYVIIDYGIAPISKFLKESFPSIPRVEINFVTIAYVMGLIVLGALVIQALSFFWQHRRVPQRVVDRLAQLRSNAIHDILNRQVVTASELALWKADEERWRAEVLTELTKHFPKAEVLGFDYLGVIQPVAFPHAYNNEHSFDLSMFAKRLSILENIIRRHSR